MSFFDGPRRGRLLGRIAAIGLGTMLIVGCSKTTEDFHTEPAATGPSEPMRLVVVDDTEFAAVLERQWKSRIESELILQQMTLEQLNDAKQLAADLIIYPSECLGTLVERKLIAAPAADALADSQYAAREIFEMQRTAEVEWGAEPYAVSFGSPQLTLIYRADLLEEQGLAVPTTWPEYQRLVESLRRDALGDLAPTDDQPWAPSLEPLGPGWAGKSLLARAASYASHPSQFSVFFDYTTMAPLIAGPPFVRALDELVVATKDCSVDLSQLGPEDVRRAVMMGQAGMGMAWPSRVTSDGQPIDLADGVALGFAPLPGSEKAYNIGEQMWTDRENGESLRVPLIGVAGRLGSVARNARRPLEAAGILVLLTGREWSARLSPQSSATTLFRASHVSKPQSWTDAGLTLEASKQYVELVASTQSQPAHLASLRIPGWQQYLAVLDQAVLAAQGGHKTSDEALSEAADQWQVITEQLGVDAQRKAYTRSIGLEP